MPADSELLSLSFRARMRRASDEEPAVVFVAQRFAPSAKFCGFSRSPLVTAAYVIPNRSLWPCEESAVVVACVLCCHPERSEGPRLDAFGFRIDASLPAEREAASAPCHASRRFTLSSQTHRLLLANCGDWRFKASAEVVVDEVEEDDAHDAGAGNGEDPGPDDAARHAPMYGGQAAGSADAGDRAGDDVG